MCLSIADLPTSTLVVVFELITFGAGDDEEVLASALDEGDDLGLFGPLDVHPLLVQREILRLPRVLQEP